LPERSLIDLILDDLINFPATEAERRHPQLRSLPGRRARPSRPPCATAPTASPVVTTLEPQSSVVARSGTMDPALTDTKSRVPICGSGKETAHGSIACHPACHNFTAGFRVEYGNSGAGMHRGAFSLRRKRTSRRPSPRGSKCRTGVASDPGRVTWCKGCREYVSRQQSDSLQARPWQRGLALFRPWWPVPYRLKRP
jgi:hypothetical protein